MAQLQSIIFAKTRHLAKKAQALAEPSFFPATAVPGLDFWLKVADALGKYIQTNFKAEIDQAALQIAHSLGTSVLAPLAIWHSEAEGTKHLSPAECIAVLKAFRHASLTLLNETDLTEKTQVHRLFDTLELEVCRTATWPPDKTISRGSCSTDRIPACENRFLSLFKSLAEAVFFLDSEHRIECLNQAAMGLLWNIEPDPSLQGATSLPDISSAPLLAETLPWLEKALQNSAPFLKQEHHLSCIVESEEKSRYFSITISRQEPSNPQSALTLIVDDITGSVETQIQLARERSLSSNYLDVVGTIVVGLDPSGTVMLINRTGCETLGYEKNDLVGHNWYKTMVPESNRKIIYDSISAIFESGEDNDDEYTNIIITKSGEHRLIAWKNRLLRNEEGAPVAILCSGTDITRQRKTEEALAEKELWLRNTFVALGEAVLIVSPENIVIDTNPAAETVFQMPREDICGKSADNLHIDTAHADEFRQLTKEAFERGESATFEFSMRRKNNQTFPTEHSVSLITGDDGTVLGEVNALRDISNRKKAERVLQESEDKFRRIFETIEEGFIVTDMDGIIQMVNPATCNLLGYEEVDLIGHNMVMLYANLDDRARLRQSLLAKGHVHGFHLTAVRKDGTHIVIESNTHLVHDKEGIPFAFEGTFRDITARIEADRVLREREKQYRAFFENNHAVMLLEDPKTGDIIDANPAASEFYGYDIETMRTMNMSQIIALTEAEVYREMHNAHSQGRSHFIFKHRLENKEIRDVEVYSGPIMVRGNQLLYSVIHDVTTRIRLEKDMTRMATTDALTGASNRHRFFLLAAAELKRAKRYKRPLAVLMLDIDYFKSINDTYGHQAGDAVLKAMAALTMANLRETDVFGRLGGEEFAVLLPETDQENALIAAERLREDLGQLKVVVNEQEIHFTVSIGLSLAHKRDKIIEETLYRADEALYKAKRGGRNRIEFGTATRS